MATKLEVLSGRASKKIPFLRLPCNKYLLAGRASGTSMCRGCGGQADRRTGACILGKSVLLDGSRYKLDYLYCLWMVAVNMLRTCEGNQVLSMLTLNFLNSSNFK